MRPIGFIAGLLFTVSLATAANAQSAAAVVSSVTADVTSRVVSEAVQGATDETLKQDDKAEAKAGNAQARAAGTAGKGRKQ